MKRYTFRTEQKDAYESICQMIDTVYADLAPEVKAEMKRAAWVTISKR